MIQYLEVGGRVPITDHVYVLGDVAGWRFTNPGFSYLDRRDAAAGLEFDFARWLKITAQGTIFQLRFKQTTALILAGKSRRNFPSPVTGTDIYLSGAYAQPFVSSILTVENSMRQDSVGAGLDTKLVGRFSFQADAQGANSFRRQQSGCGSQTAVVI